MIIIISSCWLEENRDTWIVVSVQIRVHRSTHTNLVPLVSLLPERIGNSSTIGSTIFATTIGILNKSYRVGCRLFSFSLRQSWVSIDYAESQTQAKGVCHLNPFGNVATIDWVIVAKQGTTTLCQWSKHVDCVVEFLKELFIYLILGIILLTDSSEFVVNIRDRTIMVGHTVHGKHLHDVTQCGSLFLSQFLGIGFHLSPCRHHLNHTNLEHSVTPLVTFTEVVGTIISTHSPACCMSDISRISICANTNLMLIGTSRRVVIILSS